MTADMNHQIVKRIVKPFEHRRRATLGSTPSAAKAARSSLVGFGMAMALVVLLAACSSDSGSESEVEPAPAPLEVTTTIALDDRPTSITDDITMFPQSLVDDESAVIRFSETSSDGDDTIEDVSVNVGDIVEFAGWKIHIASIGSSSLRWWAEGPNGEQIGGEPIS